MKLCGDSFPFGKFDLFMCTISLYIISNSNYKDELIMFLSQLARYCINHKSLIGGKETSVDWLLCTADTSARIKLLGVWWIDCKLLSINPSNVFFPTEVL